jgi:hypothetical protein
MSRTTQFIGLTKRAEQFIAKLAVMAPDSYITGMFDEEIPLRKWQVDGYYFRMGIIREVVQMAPWSSGPMIFTCLEWESQSGDKFRFDQWIEDPTCQGEYDVGEGIMWV